MAKDAIFMKASDFYTDPGLTVMYSDPTTSREDTVELLQQWVERQGRSWPIVLSAVTLSREMQCTYVPYLVISGTVSFDWTAVIGTQHSRQRSCYSCGGAGRRAVTRTDYSPGGIGRQTTTYQSCSGCGGSGTRTEWYEKEHRESGSIVDHNATDFIVDAAHGGTKCGEPDLQTALGNPNSLRADSGISIVPATAQTVEEVKRRLYERVNEVATGVVHVEAGRKGRVKSVEVLPVDYANTTVWVHLYPVWLSRYTYGNRVREVEVDAHTGRVYVEEPASVLLKRFAKRVLWLAAACFAVVVASGLGGEPAVQDLWSRLRLWMGTERAPEVDSGARSEPPAAPVRPGASEAPAGGGVSGARPASPAAPVRPGAADVSAGATTAAPPAVDSPRAVDSTPAETEPLAPTGDAGSESGPAAPPAANDVAGVPGAEDTAREELVGGTETRAPAGVAPSETVRVGGTIPRPAKVRNVVPEYPPIARAARIQGIVILEVVVGVDGRVTDVRVLRSVPQLDDAAVEAARQWEYAPTMRNGVPVSVILTETVNFRLP